MQLRIPIHLTIEARWIGPPQVNVWQRLLTRLVNVSSSRERHVLVRSRGRRAIERWLLGNLHPSAVKKNGAAVATPFSIVRLAETIIQFQPFSYTSDTSQHTQLQAVHETDASPSHH